VVCFNYEGFFGPDEVWPPVVDGFHDSQKLEVMGVIVLFHGGEGG